MMKYQMTEALRVGQATLPEFLAQVEPLYERETASLFIPEQDRFERLREESNRLLLRHPNWINRPQLFGMLVGIVDVFQEDAASLTKLREAGALIAGRLKLSEWDDSLAAPRPDPVSASGNPASALVSGLCGLVLGAQSTGGLMRSATSAGVVAVKPTFDRISTAGLGQISPSLSHVGFLSPDVETATHAAQALYKEWKRPTSPLRRPELGIPDGPYLQHAGAEGLAHFEMLCDLISIAGYTLHHVQVMPDFVEICKRHELILSAERDEPMTDALLARDMFRAELRRAMIDHNVDLWIAPSAIGLNLAESALMSLPWTQVGLPAVSLPAGKNYDGQPAALQLVGNWYKDESMLTWARDLEKVLSHV